LIEIKTKVGKPIIVYWIAVARLDHEYEKRSKVLENNGIPVLLLPEEAARTDQSVSLWINSHVQKLQ